MDRVHVLHLVNIPFTFLIISTYFELYMNRFLKRDKLISMTSKWNKKSIYLIVNSNLSAKSDQVDAWDTSIIQAILYLVQM